MECLVRDTGYRSESAEVDTAGRTFSLTVLLFNDTFRYVSFLRKRDISLLAVTVRERSANPVEFRSQQVRSGGEKKAFWCRAGCPSSSSKSVYSKHPVQPSLCVREMAPGFFISGGFSLGSVQYEYGRILAMEPNLQPNPLETDPIPKLIVRYAVPTSLTLMVNYLYNIVDQIFVGQGVGITGMAATNIAFPLTILVNAVALMLGDGCAANISLCLGRKEQREADSTISHALTLILASGLLAALACGIFAPQIVVLFGATPTAYAESLSYMRAIAWGIPFQLLCPAFTAIIRADGSPQYMMKCMMTGAVINLILDPIFIFPLKMGVVGAGIATVIGQVAAGCLALLYLRRLKTVHIRREDLRPTRKLTCRILALGLPSLLTQMLSALVQITLNNLMRAYGAATVYGSDIALSVYGMMMKVYQIAHSMFVGVSSAIQPINGYNFGANHYARVQKTFHIASLIAVGISVVWFLIFMVFPRQIASCFVSDNALYLDCAQHCFRLYMLAFFLYGLHMTSASFFQGIGRPGKSLLIPLARQGCFLIPLALLLSRSFGLDGALLAAPIADALAFLLCLLLARWEFRSWRRKGWLCKGERKYRAS